jgi:predicted kinase
MTRDCHGDLRAEHVVLESPVKVVDCVEFDPELRALDVADDLAFLVMDLAALGGERFAAELVDVYRAAGGDCGDDSLLSFYAAHRALVRAKVVLARAAQLPSGSAAQGHASAHVRELLALADRFSWRARLPLVIVVCGVPASGKSQLASALARASGLPLVSSDLVRKRLAGIRPGARAHPEHYTEQFSRATYRELALEALTAIDRHRGALVDATFRRREDRRAFTETFQEATPLLFAECLAPAAVLARRATVRDRSGTRISDADLSVVLRERERWEPLEEVAASDHLPLRTDRPLEEIIEDLRALLDRRLAAGRTVP